jgi:membrane dipeptidase
MPRLIFDAHLDLAWNALSFDRDLTLSIEQIRAREAGMTDEPSRGNNTVSLPELRRAGVAVCVVTLLARSGPDVPLRATCKRTDLDHASQTIASAVARGQLAYYRLLERQEFARIIRTASQLDAHWREYSNDPDRTPLGIIFSMEGADPIVDAAQLREWHDIGLRALGLAHYGRSHYACGTGVDGPLSEQGGRLLDVMGKLRIILDVTHLSDRSLAEALDRFDGPVLASHHNCRALVSGDRQLSDEQIRALLARDAVIGVALDAWMLYPHWQRGQTNRELVSLASVADHIDHICQLAGNANHAALGSDLDGGFGTEQTPRDLDTIADLQKLAPILESRGYPDADIDAIFHTNWLRLFRRALPE